MSSKTRMYVADVAPLYDKNIYDAWWEQMPEHRREKTLRYRMEADRVRSVAAYALLIMAYKDYYRENTQENSQTDIIIPKIVIGKNGKPDFDNSAFHFNLSHSGEKVVCAISDVLVGCDVEYKYEGALKIAKRFFAQSEYEVIAQCADEDKRKKIFEIVWTLKESVVKMVGDGLTFPINEFKVINNEGNVIDTFEFGKNNMKVYLKSYECNDEYGYGCCSLNSDFQEKILQLSLTDIMKNGRR